MARTTREPLSGAYRAVWRWHFYAGLLVLPFLMMLALTGGLYLFASEIDDLAARPLNVVTPGPERVPPDRWVAAARVAADGRPVAVRVPGRVDRAVEVVVQPEGGARRTVFVNPYDGQVTGVAGAPLSDTFKRIHSLEIFGGGLNVVIEIVAGWAIILVATGVFLWWPRGRKEGVVSLSTRDPARRPFWRDLHAVTGIFAGGVIVFLAATGMLWSAVWGDQVMGTLRAAGLGRPPAPAAQSWEHADHAPAGLGWTMQGSALSAPEARLDLDAVLATAAAHQVAAPFTVNLPSRPDQAVSVAVRNTRVEDSRTLYTDGSGRLLGDIRYDRYGWAARMFEWSIFTHQGTQYGTINRIVMLLACIAVWGMGISAMVMWWKRRPKGRLAAPVAPPGPRARAAVLGIVLPLAILYPLTGLSLLAALALDRLWRLVRRRSIVASGNPS
jgi:uncharacterized iron-regulated membrane protein